jgi:hypothetical protein
MRFLSKGAEILIVPHFPIETSSQVETGVSVGRDMTLFRLICVLSPIDASQQARQSNATQPANPANPFQSDHQDSRRKASQPPVVDAAGGFERRIVTIGAACQPDLEPCL